jgi:hypothetical protein
MRQNYGGSNPPRQDIVSVASLAVAERFGLPIVPIAERNRTGQFAFKLTNGGGSDHVPFGNRGIPNANHTFRGTLDYPARTGDITSGAWNGTVPLESRYHTTGDTFNFNYSPERMEIALKIAGASSYEIARIKPKFTITYHNFRNGLHAGTGKPVVREGEILVLPTESDFLAVPIAWGLRADEKFEGNWVEWRGGFWVPVDVTNGYIVVTRNMTIRPVAVPR